MMDLGGLAAVGPARGSLGSPFGVKPAYFGKRFIPPAAQSIAPATIAEFGARYLPPVVTPLPNPLKDIQDALYFDFGDWMAQLAQSGRR